MPVDPFTLKAIGNAVTQAVSPAVQVAPALIGEAAGQLTFAARKNRDMMKRDYSALVNNRLGLTAAQKAQMSGQGQKAIQAATALQSEQLRRQAAAGGIGAAGAMADQQGALAAATANAAAQSQQGIEQLSQQQALTKEAQVRTMLNQREQQGKDDWRRVGSLLQAGKGQVAPTDTSFIGRSSAYAGQMSGQPTRVMINGVPVANG